jgi:propanol-preferring alcohol dehydrogenase
VFRGVAFAAEGKVRAHIHTKALEDINDVFAALKKGAVDGRIVLDYNPTASAAYHREEAIGVRA